MNYRLIHADVLDGLRQLADESVQVCVTSPPYWGLRDYGIAGQSGLERTPEEYVARKVVEFREVRRVLRKDGTLWLNIGDSYAGGGRGGNPVFTICDDCWPKYGPGAQRSTPPSEQRGAREDDDGSYGPLDAWLTHLVNEGVGAVFFANTEDGDIGVFLDTGKGEAEKSLGRGDTAFEAIEAARERREK